MRVPEVSPSAPKPAPPKTAAPAAPKSSPPKPAAPKPAPKPAPPPSPLDDDLDAYGLAEEPEVARQPEEELFTPEGPSRGVKAKATGKKNGRVNIIPGWVEPSDMEEVKRLAALMGLDIILFPDTSGVLNGALTGEYKMFPEGGTPIADLVAAGDAIDTLALGEWCSADAARWLDTQCKVPCSVLDMPFGLKATDRFIDSTRARVSTNSAVTFSVSLRRSSTWQIFCSSSSVASSLSVGTEMLIAA